MRRIINEFSTSLLINEIKYVNMGEYSHILHTPVLCLKCNLLTKWELDEAKDLCKKIHKKGLYRSHFRNNVQLNTFINKIKIMNGLFVFDDYCCDGGGVMIRLPT